MSNHLFHILLAEDNPGDARLTMEALKDGRFLCQVHLAKDGVEAMEFLRRQGDRYKDVPRPDLILLDLNMPRKDGREVLHELKNDPDLKSIPVIVLTTSDIEQDIEASYLQGANSFITKPMDVQEFFDIVEQLGVYWSQVVTLPR